MVPLVPAIQYPMFNQTNSSNGTATGFIDTQNFDYAVIILGGITQATNPPLALAVSHGATSVVTNQTAIVALTGGTSVVAGSTGFVIPGSGTVVTSGYKVAFMVDCRGKERYLGIRYTSAAAATTTINAVALLFRGDEIPTVAAKAQVDALVTE